MNTGTSDNSAPKILMVEDDMIIAADVSMQLTKLGYEVIGINTRGEDALNTIEGNRPDIILMDIMLTGKMNGIETAQIILEKHQVPLIFLTSNSDDATFQQASAAKPYAFISKPFQKSELERTLKLTLQRIAVEKASEPVPESTDHVSAMEDRLFIRHKDQMVKVMLTEILYAEADRNYCKIYTENQTFLLSVPLRNIESQLPTKIFFRVHRSFVVNLKKIDAISEHHEYLTIQSHQVPVSRRSKEEVVKRLKMI
ncbi:LytR/AlgR family response regulator transcription factor [Neolewinella persica]|uniref:LytR/AlgR family response regulator transcription factor n=1 Tax=Neolewinella persica TaxID=70998 RepID=UPI00037EBAE7|nr:LytTR family transcriptional regulator DNA-binding domain-containing protein [Neolewinella persica]